MMMMMDDDDDVVVVVESKICYRLGVVSLETISNSNSTSKLPLSAPSCQDRD